MGAQRTYDAVGKDERISLRAGAERRRLFEAASAAEGRSVSVFILDATTIAAEHVLADRTVFRLSEERWAAFDALSGRPARDLPRLCELPRHPHGPRRGSVSTPYLRLRARGEAARRPVGPRVLAGGGGRGRVSGITGNPLEHGSRRPDAARAEDRRGSRGVPAVRRRGADGR
ncbi:type II toxin-antitoxin system TacA family antitoxin [Streptosporangium sandarakinum]